MHDPIATGRRSALRAVAVQAVVSLLVSLAFLAKGLPWSLAALVGGGAMTLGNGLAAWMSLRGIERAPVAFARLLVGTLAKWCAVFALVVLALWTWRLPPLPLLAGLVAGLLAYLLATAAGPRTTTGSRTTDSSGGRASRGRQATKG